MTDYRVRLESKQIELVLRLWTGEGRSDDAILSLRELFDFDSVLLDGVVEEVRIDEWDKKGVCGVGDKVRVRRSDLVIKRDREREGEYFGYVREGRVVVVERGRSAADMLRKK